MADEPTPDTSAPPKVKGSPLPDSDADLDGRSRVGEGDLDAAERFWKKYASGVGLGGLFDAGGWEGGGEGEG